MGRGGGAPRAGPADAAELTRLRALMFGAMGRSGDESWRSACEADLRELLAWFAAAGAGTATLSATAEAEALYRSLGFTAPPHPALRLALSAHAGSAGDLAADPAADPAAGPGAGPGTEAGAGSGSSGLGRELTAGDPDA